MHQKYKMTEKNRKYPSNKWTRFQVKILEFFARKLVDRELERIVRKPLCVAMRFWNWVYFSQLRALTFYVGNVQNKFALLEVVESYTEWLKV